MKTKFIQPLIWALAFALALPACKKDNGAEPDDPYTPPAEGKAFMPVLAHKVDMERVEKIEKARGGRLSKVTHSDEGNYDTYVFEYGFFQETDVQEIVYEVRTADKILLKAEVKLPTYIGARDMKNLLKKEGFNDDHILSKIAASDLAREDEDALFSCRIKDLDPGKWFHFKQFDKQRKSMPTIKDLNGYWYDFLNNQAFKITQVRNFESRYKSTLLEEKKVTDGKYANQIRHAMYRTHANHAPQIIRGYFFNWDEELSPQESGHINEIIFIYTDPALGFYRDEIHKIDIPTREMLALLKKGGFKIETTYWSEDHYVFYFKNETKKLKYVLRACTFDDVEGGRKIMALNLFENKDD